MQDVTTPHKLSSSSSSGLHSSSGSTSACGRRGQGAAGYRIQIPQAFMSSKASKSCADSSTWRFERRGSMRPFFQSHSTAFCCSRRFCSSSSRFFRSSCLTSLRRAFSSGQLQALVVSSSPSFQKLLPPPPASGWPGRASCVLRAPHPLVVAAHLQLSKMLQADTCHTEHLQHCTEASACSLFLLLFPSLLLLTRTNSTSTLFKLKLGLTLLAQTLELGNLLVLLAAFIGQSRPGLGASRMHTTWRGRQHSDQDGATSHEKHQVPAQLCSAPPTFFRCSSIWRWRAATRASQDLPGLKARHMSASRSSMTLGYFSSSTAIRN